MAKVISKNKRAYFDYEIMDKYEAGIVLSGWEIKSIRAGKVNLKGAFCSFKGNELLVSNMHISQYMAVRGDETQPRKLLLHKKQLTKLKNKVKDRGMAIVPTVLKLSSKGLAKLDIALAKGKNIVDKRQTIKERDNKRDVRKHMGM